MFNRKNQKVTVPTIETRQATVPTVAGIKSAIGPVASRAKSLFDEQAEHGRALAAPRIESARSAVAPHLQDARSAVAPRIADARHHVEADYLPKLVDAKDQFANDTLPKVALAVSSALGGSQLAGFEAVRRISDSEAAHRASDAARVLRGEAVATTKKTGRGIVSGLMATLGILGAAGTAAWFFNKRAAEQEDPWARPLAEPYIDDVAASTQVGTVGQVSDASAFEGEQIPTGASGGGGVGALDEASGQSVAGGDVVSESVAGTDAAAGSIAGTDASPIPAEDTVLGVDSASESVAGEDAASGSVAGEDGPGENAGESRNF